MFAIAEFGDGVAIISAKWFDGVEEERAFWLPGDGAAVARLTRQHAEPASTWTSYPIRVMGKAGNYPSSTYIPMLFKWQASAVVTGDGGVFPTLVNVSIVYMGIA